MNELCRVFGCVGAGGFSDRERPRVRSKGRKAMSTTIQSVFGAAIQRSIDEFPAGKDAPNHSTSRRVGRIDKLHVPDDICAKKHKGDLASGLAFERGRKSHAMVRAEIVEIFRAHGSLTSKEVSAIYYGVPGKDKNHTSPRLSEMKADGIIERTGEMRGGCHVLRLVSHE